MSKIGRNDPCWCSSGKKYKNCHWGKEDKIPYEFIKNSYKKTFGKEYCIVPENMKAECTGKIINAHSIQKSGVLELISRDGHIYQIDKDPLSLYKSGTIQPNLVGINKASTFTGFCASHDKSIFSEIEDKSFDLKSNHHYFLLCYRALCRELFSKNAQNDHTDYTKKMLLGKSGAIKKLLNSALKPMEEGVSYGLRDTLHQKLIFDNMLTSNEYTEIKYYTIEFDMIPDIMCSGFYNPPYDFNNKKIQEMTNNDVITDYMSYTLISLNKKGYCIFVWGEDNSGANYKLIKSLNNYPAETISDLLVSYTFETFENVFMSPNWYENLDNEKKSHINELIVSSPYINYYLNHDSFNKVKTNFVNWKINNIYTNIEF